MYVCMVVDDRTGADSFQFFQIEILNVLCGQFLERNTLFTKIRGDYFFDHIGIRSERCNSNGAFHNRKPLFHIVGKEHIILRGDIILKLAALLHQERFCFLFVALYRESGCNPLGFSIAKCICIV